MMQVTCSTQNSPSLTSIPPELLLRIVSFLPGPSAFLALAQTSPGLRQFFCLHASGICNDYILSRFLSSAVLFDSRIQNGWLVPTDSSVWHEEHLLLERKRRYCAARRGQTPPIQQPRVDTLAISTHDTGYRPSTCTSRYRNNRDNTDLRFPLSSPGPLYLAFLEEYGWDVEIFSEPLNYRDMGHDNATYESEQEKNNERDKRKSGVMWKVSTYTIRPFLQKLDATILNDCGCGAGSDANPSSAPPPQTKPMNGLGYKLLVRSGLGKIFPFLRIPKVESEQRLFGELPLEPENQKLRTGGKCGLGKETMSAVLLWTMVSGYVEGLVPSPVSNNTEVPLLGERKVRTLFVFYSCQMA